MATTKWIAVDDIRSDGGTQTRAELRSDVIEEYADAMRSGAEFPPVDVFLDKNGNYWLADGFHRFSAAAIAEREKIAANVHKGELREAIWFALSANTTNGIRLTNPDKRRRVELALADGEWKTLNDEAIAGHIGVSHAFVHKVRSELSTVESSPEPVKRVGKDGKKRPATYAKRSQEPRQSTATAVAEPESTEEDDADLVARCTIKANAIKWFDKVEEAIDELGGGLDRERRAIREFFES